MRFLHAVSKKIHSANRARLHVRYLLLMMSQASLDNTAVWLKVQGSFETPIEAYVPPVDPLIEETYAFHLELDPPTLPRVDRGSQGCRTSKITAIVEECEEEEADCLQSAWKTKIEDEEGFDRLVSQVVSQVQTSIQDLEIARIVNTDIDTYLGYANTTSHIKNELQTRAIDPERDSLLSGMTYF